MFLKLSKKWKGFKKATSNPGRDFEKVLPIRIEIFKEFWNFFFQKLDLGGCGEKKKKKNYSLIE